MTACVFCQEAGGEVLWEDDACRVVWAYEPDYPALCRVIWDRHVKEMADMPVEHIETGPGASSASATPVGAGSAG